MSEQVRATHSSDLSRGVLSASGSLGFSPKLRARSESRMVASGTVVGPAEGPSCARLFVILHLLVQTG